MSLSDPNIQADLAPDYNISNQQFTIGLFAYLLLVGRRYWFIWEAGSMEDPRLTHDPCVPTWVPPCSSNSSWPSIWDAPSRGDPENSQALSITRPQLGGEGMQLVFVGEGEQRSSYLSEVLSSYSERVPGYEEDAIDAASGALILNVTHIFSLRDGICLRKTHGSIHVYDIPVRDERGAWTPSALVLLSMGSLEIQPESDHVFMPNSIKDRYLLVRQQLGGKAHRNSFQLITARIRIRVVGDGYNPLLDELLNPQYHNSERWSHVWLLSHHIPMDPYSNQRRRSIIGPTNKSADLAGRSLRSCYPTLALNREVLRHYHGFGQIGLNASTKEGVDELSTKLVRLWDALWHQYDTEQGKVAFTAAARATVFEAIVVSISVKYRARITHDEGYRPGWLILTFPHDEWFLEVSLVLSWTVSFDYEWSYVGEKRWHPATVLPAFKIQEPRRTQVGQINIRMELGDFFLITRKYSGQAESILYDLVHFYNPPLDLSTVTQMIIDGPTEEQWRTGLLKYLGDVLIDGSQSRIRIVQAH
jgi:hypothetical protein